MSKSPFWGSVSVAPDTDETAKTQEKQILKLPDAYILAPQGFYVRDPKNNTIWRCFIHEFNRCGLQLSRQSKKMTDVKNCRTINGEYIYAIESVDMQTRHNKLWDPIIGKTKKQGQEWLKTLELLK